MSTFIFPGDALPVDPTVPIKLGPGIYCDPNSQEVRPVNTGILHVSTKGKSGAQAVYVDYSSKRYVPSVNDFVIGTITGTFSDSYKVLLQNFSSSVSLSYMAFPNASKKNRPTLQVGDLVYARVCTAEKELEAEIECVDSATGRDAGFGLLEDGMIIDVNLNFARQLLFNNDFPLLKVLAAHTKFEIAIGLNGKIWVKCDELSNTLACYRTILECCQKNDVATFKDIAKRQFEEVLNVKEE
ncbi:exosome non-catalytic core subunit rrp40 [Saccharomyces pastorianus]|uniref:Exosome non-catalytic core subunit rrp40 n=1 Tax=Saccharomyces pastorianus TaxID=27292 RepID=A0A6C1EFK2_SACPS|nr:RRP40-like protein [Saccharomyces eubayanus]KOG98938.1 RRP40-like protein [Saccharomyces eubayanus]QID87855.1 exosome non-catalytic core subunit rrp40 [Saccharomyces pastorianus]